MDWKWITVKRMRRKSQIGLMLTHSTILLVLFTNMGDWFFDFPEEEATHLMKEPDFLYSEYFAAVEKAANSGLLI